MYQVPISRFSIELPLDEKEIRRRLALIVNQKRPMSAIEMIGTSPEQLAGNNEPFYGHLHKDGFRIAQNDGLFVKDADRSVKRRSSRKLFGWRAPFPILSGTFSASSSGTLVAVNASVSLFLLFLEIASLLFFCSMALSMIRIAQHNLKAGLFGAAFCLFLVSLPLRDLFWYFRNVRVSKDRMKDLLSRSAEDFKNIVAAESDDKEIPLEFEFDALLERLNSQRHHSKVKSRQILSQIFNPYAVCLLKNGPILFVPLFILATSVVTGYLFLRQGSPPPWEGLTEILVAIFFVVLAMVLIICRLTTSRFKPEGKRVGIKVDSKGVEVGYVGMSSEFVPWNKFCHYEDEENGIMLYLQTKFFFVVPFIFIWLPKSGLKRGSYSDLRSLISDRLPSGDS